MAAVAKTSNRHVALRNTALETQHLKRFCNCYLANLIRDKSSSAGYQGPAISQNAPSSVCVWPWPFIRDPRTRVPTATQARDGHIRPGHESKIGHSVAERAKKWRQRRRRRVSSAEEIQPSTTVDGGHVGGTA